MSNKTILNNKKFQRGIIPAVYATTAAANAAAQAIDIVDANSCVLYCVASTVSNGGTTPPTFKLQTCDTQAGTYADVKKLSDNSVPTVSLAAVGDAVMEVNRMAHNLNRWVKVVCTNAAASDLYGAVVISGNYTKNPPS